MKKPQMGRWIYAVIGGGGILLYGAGEVQGWETGATAKAPNVNRGPNVRSAPGGYRTWVYWHGGYRRGK
jgi:hypothetical protein